MNREEEWYEMIEDEQNKEVMEYENVANSLLKKAVESKQQSIEDSAFKVLLEMSPDHLAAVNYLLQNCVRREGTNEDSHWKYIHSAVDLVKMGEEAFLNQK